MSIVSVSELKAHLSRYLREVRAGGEVQIVDRGVPVARLVPQGRSHGDADRWDRLVRAGVLRAGTGDPSVLALPPIVVAGADLTSALSADREDRV